VGRKRKREREREREGEGERERERERKGRERGAIFFPFLPLFCAWSRVRALFKSWSPNAEFRRGKTIKSTTSTWPGLVSNTASFQKDRPNNR